MSDIKQAKFEDSNIAKLGSDEDLAQRVAAAKTEVEWKGAGEKVGIQIWRVEKLTIKSWPVEEYGSFYEGDSYIVLYTYKEKDSEKLKWNVHFWLGRETSQDEAGVAAYKTVELDDLLGTAPVQYREVMGYESNLFLSYFKDGIKIMKGGIESGFNKVGPKEYKTKLLHIKGSKARVQVVEVPTNCDSLNDGDAFVLDAGLKVFTWMGSNAAGSEKFKATQVANNIKNARKGCEVERLESEGSDEFWSALGGKGTIKTKEEGEDEMEIQSNKKHSLFHLSDDKDGDGKMEFEKVAEGQLKYNMLKSDDVFIADVGDSCIVWIGKNASKKEKKNALPYANKYLGLNNRPVWLPIIRVMEGDEGSLFGKVFE